jgi:hypothetical protein
MITFRDVPWVEIKILKGAGCVRCGRRINPGFRTFRPLAERSGVVVRGDRLCGRCGDKFGVAVPDPCAECGIPAADRPADCKVG